MRIMCMSALEADEHPGLTEMKELERLAAKSPCMMTKSSGNSTKAGR